MSHCYRVRYHERNRDPLSIIQVEQSELPPLADGEVQLKVLAAPINPSDILTLTGDYGMLPDLPATGGNEGVGRVAALGNGVDQLEVGQTVLLPVGCGTWASHIVAKAKELIPLPDQADPKQLAMLTINPPTAWLLLEQFVELKEGDWVIQNAANSAVGLYLVQLAKARGIKCISVVRREGAAEMVREAGGEHVVIDGDDLAEQVKTIRGDGKIGLGIDAVGGAATDRLADCLRPGGTLVNYGMMGGKSCEISPKHLIFRGISLRGFWLAQWFDKAEPAQQQKLYGELVKLIATGQLSAPIDQCFDIQDAKQAIARAASGERNGKVLFTPKH
jgi:NADPH:quinone reductase-like Zn-dependent oxidoreductase